tara:strand:+ start:15533 stop:16543 length:1011 start_codon:yes stop_codon:yes gene_type:complete
MSKILVTGVCGHIGSHLAKMLVSQGEEVVGIDNLSCGFMENINLIKDIHSDRFSFIDCDIRDDITELQKNEHIKNIDIIFHLAARGETYYCRNNPIEAVDNNINGTINMLHLGDELKIKHFFFADTSAEYDSLENISHYPSIEEFAPNNITPMGVYAITKMAASQFVRSYGKRFGFGSTLFRYTNVYGPSMNLERDIPPVIGAFADRLFNGKSPIIYGDGGKQRDFIHINDLTMLHNYAINRRFEELDTKTYNAGSGEKYSIFEIYRLVWEACYRNKQDIPPLKSVEYKLDQPNEAQITQADISLASFDFGWRPYIDIKMGIDMTVDELYKRTIKG